MPVVEFTDQRGRLERIVRNALDGSLYEASREEESGRMLVIEATRPEGKHVGLRFRGVKDSQSTETPAAGAPLMLRGVGSAERFSLLRVFFPFFRTPGAGYARVRIDAGNARLEIVCQDAEWWEN